LLFLRYLPYTPLARNSRSGAIRAGRIPGLVRLADMSRTERKCVEPSRDGSAGKMVLRPFEGFAAWTGDLIGDRWLEAEGGPEGAPDGAAVTPF